jgi:hypothetical protein
MSERFRQIARARAAEIEYGFGHCCGDVINIYSEELEKCLQDAMDEAYEMGRQDAIAKVR